MTLRAGHFTVQAQERVVFGEPAETVVPAEARRCGCARVFVLSTASLARLDHGPLQRAVRGLDGLHVGTFAAIRAHSPREDVIAAANAAREARADLLVAVGGGSVIDAAKVVQLCLWHGVATPDSMGPYRNGAPPDIARDIEAPGGAIRMIAVSTTLSASEFTCRAAVTDLATHTKQAFEHRLFAPRAVVLDPSATLDTPLWLLLSTGMRAVDHAVESYCSPLANPATEPLSLQGLSLLARALPRIHSAPQDLEARLEAQFGMWQAIAAAAAGVTTGASHGIGYVLGGTYGVPHGHTSCAVLPSVLRWNSVANAERQRALSHAMGEPQRPAADLVRDLVRKLDQPASLREVGVLRDQLDDIAQRALMYPQMRSNPRPIRSAADVREILDLAYSP
jgi:maleylacetate reductase